MAIAQPKPAPAKPVPAKPAPATLELVWVVSAPIPNPKDPQNGYPLLPLTLIAGTERIVLKPQLGGLKPYNQSVCATTDGSPYHLEGTEVAKITFKEGGAGGYLVRRGQRGFELVAWEDGGLCEDKKTRQLTKCGAGKKLVRMIAAPANAKVIEKLMVADKAGKQTAFDCKAED